MKNFQITDSYGKQYWIARSIAVAGFIFKTNKYKTELMILANKRGSGTNNHTGLWNCPCGYLDFDETLAEACSREIMEECGLVVDPGKLILNYVEDDPKAFRQNVTHRFTAFLGGDDDTCVFIGSEGEIDEVEQVKWIQLSDIDNYEWAFNQGEIIKAIADKYNYHLS